MKKILSLLLLFSVGVNAAELSTNVAEALTDNASEVATNVGLDVAKASTSKLMCDFIEKMSPEITTVNASKVTLMVLGVYYTYNYIMPTVQKNIEKALNMNDKTQLMDYVELRLNARNALYNWHLIDYPTAYEVEKNVSDIVTAMKDEYVNGFPIISKFIAYNQTEGHLKDCIGKLQKILPKYKTRRGFMYCIQDVYTIDDLVKIEAGRLGLIVDDLADYVNINDQEFRDIKQAVINNYGWSSIQQRIITAYLDARQKEIRLNVLSNLAKTALGRINQLVNVNQNAQHAQQRERFVNQPVHHF